MVKLAKIVIPSLYNPQFYFNEMISDHEQSFKRDVDKKDLLEMVDQMTRRVSDGEIAFEHLQMSNSRIHNLFKPYTEKTFLMFQRILEDIVDSADTKLTQDELKVIFKIF